MNAMKRVLWWLLAGSVGAVNRGRILEELLQTPHNAIELAKLMMLDYKTIRHHLEVLEKNRLRKETSSVFLREAISTEESSPRTRSYVGLLVCTDMIKKTTCCISCG